MTKTSLAIFASQFIAVALADLPTSDKVLEVNVPSGETLVVSRLADYFTGQVQPGSEHYFNKTGEGTLILSGDVQYLNLNLSNGVVRVARKDNSECLRNVVVSEEGTLVFDQDNGMRTLGDLHSYGTVDMNGHRANFSVLTCYPGSSLVNSSSTRGRLEIKDALNMADAITQIKFVVTKTYETAISAGLSEIAPTHNGVPVVNAPEFGGMDDSNLWKLLDRDATTGVTSLPIGTGVGVTLNCGEQTINGYRLAARVNGTGGVESNTPTSWEVYGYINKKWELLDKRDDVSVADAYCGFGKVLGREFRFAKGLTLDGKVDIVYTKGSLSPSVATDFVNSYSVITGSNGEQLGAVSVNGGSVAVVAPREGAYVAKAVRIRPVATVGSATGPDAYNYNWALGYFKLVDADGKVFNASDAKCSMTLGGSGANAFKAGTDSTRTIVANAVGAKDMTPVVLLLEGERTIAGYVWRASNNSNDRTRMPTSFRIEVSGDDKSWNAADKEWRTVDYAEFAADSTDYNRPQRNFPKDCAQRARYFRFEVFRTVYPTDYYMQLSEINLYRNGVRVAWPAGSTPSGNKLINNVKTGTGNAERILASALPYKLEVDAGEILEFDSFGYTTTGGGYYDRMPRGWSLSVRNSTSEPWKIVQATDDAQGLVKTDYADQGPWSAACAVNGIGDEAELLLTATAVMELNLPFERMGSLHGAGTLQLDDATAEVSVGGGDFSGSISGAGTFVIAADQNFDAADLSGVNTIEFASGKMTGAASFGGNPITLKFDEGALDATLSNLGPITVAGVVRVVIPDRSLVEARPYHKVLVSGAELDGAAKSAFRNAAFVSSGDLKGVQVSVNVTDDSVEVSARIPGLMLLVR